MTSETTAPDLTFDDLNLTKTVLKAVKDCGYETPTNIQAMTIPPLMAGKDLVGQAQTGTGKTAAFALPILSRINVNAKSPQAIILAPTRELAIQVAEAFQTYASGMKKFTIAPIYGGQDYAKQIKLLKRGVQVVVGTPGRVMDHMRRGTLVLDDIQYLVLDEADEMLKMGFIDDVKWILEQTPEDRQTALFSATMPKPIRAIAQEHLNDPVEITIKAQNITADNIRQRYWPVSGVHKLDALTRILEVEETDGMIIFVRTKSETLLLNEKLHARGFNCGAINGDMSQSSREQMIGWLKAGRTDILIATDVAARGLDVDRISHVVNYDIPYDAESYIHRVGRTGRAGRKGEAILFVAPRERRMLSIIEKATKQKIEMMELPTTEMVNDRRVANFKQKITDTIAANDMGYFTELLQGYCTEHNVPAIEVAAALAKMMYKKKPLLLKVADKAKLEAKGFDTSGKYGELKVRKPSKGMEYFIIEVGRKHTINPGMIMDCLSDEEDGVVEREHIGRISIMGEYSCIELPEGMPKEIMQHLKDMEIAGQKLNITRLDKSFYKPRKKDAMLRGKPKHKRSGKPVKVRGAGKKGPRGGGSKGGGNKGGRRVKKSSFFD